MEEKNKKKEYKMILRLDKETLEKLDKIAKDKYRGTNRSQAIRWMIKDMEVA